MKKYAASKLELRLLKNEVQRVNQGYGFLYEQQRIKETEKILNSIHATIALRQVRKTVHYKKAVKSHEGL